MKHRPSNAFVAIGIGAVVLAVSAQSQPAPADQWKALARESLSTISGDLRVSGLKAPVQVLRDRWGVPHIYAQNVDDLFMAQGYVMAQDRLWQMEMWRRQREGRLAEILGPQAVNRDRTARLLKYRGPMDDREWTSYHPEGKRIFTAYAAGVNAFITERRDNLPVEFKLTGITPEPWTPETLVLRSATFGNASSELTLARNVARLGVEAANKQSAPDPWDDLKVPDGLDVSIIDDTVTTGGRGGGGAIRPEMVEPYRRWITGSGVPEFRGSGVRVVERSEVLDDPGSNNWVISGKLSATGKPVVANDPHRDVSNPSLRYIVHLNAPGWNVIGAGEPPFVGVAIGHNDRLGWGLTIVGTDQEDVFVEEVNPSNPNEVKWQGKWEPLKIVREEIKVRSAATPGRASGVGLLGPPQASALGGVQGAPPIKIEIKFSRHGPIFHEDVKRHRVYALRSALHEPGTASYLGGLRLAQAKNCREFLDAAMYWKSPSENLICGDVDGNISWQASALTPKRNGWVGRLPVPGTGSFEWDGFRSDLPRELNPARGFIATANNQIQPKDYSPPMMFKSSSNVRFDRITRLLQLIKPVLSGAEGPGGSYTLDDHRKMQLDALSLSAQAALPLFKGWSSSQPDVERARQMLADWDAVQARESAAAAIYSAWRAASSTQERDPARPVDQRKPLHEASLTKAIAQLQSTQGSDWPAWRWGRIYTASFPHLLVRTFDLPTIERRGGTGTLAAQGATYREILDAADWDRSIVTNVPGQSGQPESPFYGNLVKLFAVDEYFPLVFSRARVEKETTHRLVLKPR